MSARSTVAVLVAAAILIVVAVALDRGEPVEAPGAAGGLLVGPGELPVDAIDRITLRREGEPTLVFARGEGGWMQIEPFRHPMDFFSIRQLAVLAGQVEVVRELDEDEVEAGDLHLDPPRAQVVYEWADGRLELALGRRSVAGRAFAARDGRAYVVTGELYERAADMNPADWRDRTIFPGASVDADRVVIAGGPTRTVLERDRRRWRVVEPVRTRLDPAAGDALFAALGRAQLGGFILDRPPDLASFGLGEPSGVIEVESSSGTQRLYVGAPMGVGSGDRFGLVEGRPVVVRVPEAVLEAFFRPAQDLVDRTACGTEPADVKAVVIRGPEGELRIERSLERWLAPQRDAEVNAAAADELLDLLSGRRADEVELRPWPRELEMATVTLYGFDARPMDTVRIARDPATGRWALENGDSVLRLFPAETTVPLTWEALHPTP